MKTLLDKLASVFRNVHGEFKTSMKDLYDCILEVVKGASCYGITNERGYHNIIYGLLSGLSNSNLRVQNEVESGHGRCDLVIRKVSEKSIHVLEFKALKIAENKEDQRVELNGKSSKVALLQAISKEYHYQFREDKVFLLGISFWKKHCALIGHVWNNEEDGVLDCLFFDEANPEGAEREVLNPKRKCRS